MVKFTVLDLNYILVQIEMAEAGQPPVNPLLSFGLREVAGTNNNLVPGQSLYGSTDQVFPTLTDPLFRNIQGANYTSTSNGILFDAQPRMISNLISDQTANNPAALAAQAEQFSFLGFGYQNTTTPGADGRYGATTAYIVSGGAGADGVYGDGSGGDTDDLSGAGADGIFGTADDLIVEAGKDGVFGTADDVKGTRGDITTTIGGVTTTTPGLLTNLSMGADGAFGVTTAFAVISNGVDGIFGTGDDIVDEFGLNGIQEGNVAGSDDVIGTRGSLLHILDAGTDMIFGTADDVVTDDIVTDDKASGNQSTPTDASDSSSSLPGLGQSLFINNVTPDNGLSAPSNSWFTFFGQFFDHGLDLIDKGGNGTVFIQLAPDDPLYDKGKDGVVDLNPATSDDGFGADGIRGTADDRPNFMLLTRATDLPGPDGLLGTADDIHQGTNQTSPFIDQSQTYASDSSHQVFLRDYMIGVDGALHSSGALLAHRVAGADGLLNTADDTFTMATWGDLKAQAATKLGILLTDADVGNVPLLATDAYGNFLRGPLRGMPQLVVRNADGTTSLVEGDTANPISTANALRTGHAFINDMAHSASPTDDFGRPLRPDTDTAASPNNGIGVFDVSGAPAGPGFYDNELLDAHYVAGDGRVNENIGLTAVQEIFHAEHGRLLAQIQATVQTQLDEGNTSFVLNWVLPGTNLANNADGSTHVIAANEWNGERLFQAAKFGTETEYQHLVFEEFARYIAPSIHLAGPVNVHIDPAITSEFANVVYRFGHSMLDENVNLYQIDPATGKPIIDPATGQPMMTEEGLIQAFTNPALFASSPNMTADIILGTVNQVSNSIDEFVTGSLRNNLLGLPLDLAALNIARGRDTGVAPLNLVRNQLFAETGEAQLAAYKSWADFGSQLKHPESLVNFIAAYGTHYTITTYTDPATLATRATTMEERRAAADALVESGTLGGKLPFSSDAYDFLNSVGVYANATGAAATADFRTIHDAAGNEAAWSTGSVTGVDAIDMWIGGLAEKISLFGGQLGSTFEYVFRTQMEALQDGDRMYYLPRIEGMDYEESLQDSSLAQLIRANTDIKHLPGNIFLTPEYTIEASTYVNYDANGNFLSIKDPLNANNTWLRNPSNGKLLVNVLPDGTVQYLGDDNFLGNTIVLGGTDNNDRLIAGAADDDTVWGDAGNDYIDGGGGNDFLFGGTGDDTLIGGQGDDTIHGDEGNDTIYGGDGIDTIFGGDGNDYIEGGRGDDVILGGLGNDIIIGNEGFDELTGGEGDDWLESRGGQGQLMFGDSGAPTGGLPLYSGNDVMIGGVAGGDIMKGFSGDDIMVGNGSFTKFIGGLGFDWGSYEFASHGVTEDMNRKEFISPNGSEDAIRDIWQHTEGASGSAFDDIIIGDNSIKLLTTFDDLNNVNLISGLQSFFAPGPVSFSGGNIILGGGGNDQMSGGAGNDIIEGDAFLHVALTSYSAGGQIIRQINYDPNANNFDPAAYVIPAGPAAGIPLMLAGFVANIPGAVAFPDPVFANLRAAGALPANVNNVANPTNVDTAVFNDVFANYGNLFGLFGGNAGDPFFDGVPGLDAEGFLTINHTGVNVVVGGNPQGLAGINDGTDRIRGIERLQFTDGTVAIDPYGNILSWSFSQVVDPYAAALGGIDPFYDAVPVGTPTITESGGLDPATTVNVGQTLTANLTAIVDAAGAPHVALTDADGIAGAFAYQWQYDDAARGQWVDIAGGTNATFVPSAFFDGVLGLRVKVSYTDGKGYKETVTSAPTAAVSLAGGVNTAPTIVSGQQFNGVANTTALLGQGFTFFSPFSSIFTDEQTAPAAMTYTATVSADGSNVSSLGLRFRFDPVTGSGEFTSAVDGGDGVVGVNDVGPAATGLDDDIATPWNPAPGQYAIRVLGIDQGGLAVASTFSINVMPTDTAPVANNDAYSILESSTLSSVQTAQKSVLSNDTDADAGDRLTARLVTGPSNGTLQFNTDGTFVYTPTVNYTGPDSFTYVADDAFLQDSNVATVALTVTPKAHVVTAALLNDTGDGSPGSASDGLTNDSTLAGKGFAGAAIFAAVDGAAPVRIGTGNAITGDWTAAPVLADGFHTIVISETTATGRTDTATVSFTLDTTPPPVSVALVSDTGASNTDGVTQNPALTGISDPNASVLVKIDTDPAVVVPTDAFGVWTLADAVADGTHTAFVTGATDKAGNTGHASLTFTVDRLPPPLTEALLHDTGASATDNITNDDTIAGSGDAFASVFAVIDGVASAVPAATADLNGNWSFKPVLADGKHVVAVTETDLAGNSTTKSLSFTLDTAPPPVTVALKNDTGRSATDGITKDATLTGKGDPNASVQISIDGGPASSIPTSNTGAWTYIPPVADGTYTATVTETDLAGNTATATQIFTLDTAAPVAPSGGGLTFTANAAQTALTGFTLTGSAEANSTITVSNGATIGTTLVPASGLWAATIVPAPASNFSELLTVTSTDAAGNVSVGQLTGLVVGNGVANALTATGPAGTENYIIGLAGNDTMTGGSGNDTLDGGLGNDAMSGGAGDDTYIVDAAGDTVNETANNGIDTVRTTLATYTLTANVENLTYTGAAAFNGTGNNLANVITGGAGADTLTDGANAAGQGPDTLIGGAGNDTYNVSNAGDIVTEVAGGGTDIVRTSLNSYTLGINLENLTFTGAGNFAGTGNTAANVITGGVGNDTLDGGANAAGVDTLVGGAGNDTYIVRNVGDVVTEAAAAGTDTELTALASLTLSANVENLTYTGAGNFTGTGNNQGNVITGGVGNDTLDSGANAAGQGPDTLIGGAGNDTYIVRNATDVVTEAAGGGTDTEQTALASRILDANVENLAYTGAANFTGTGNNLANVITGGVGNDTLNDGTNDAGQPGDTLIGGAGNDTYNVTNVGDVITETAGGGTDTVRTTLGSYTLAANVENLTFTGAGNFTGTGNNLANVITGGAGNDTLDGGVNTTGVDTLIGGLGDDTYFVRNTTDVVTEAAGAGTDTVNAAINAYTLGTNVENLTFIGTGNFTGTGNAGNNVIVGGAGVDILSGGGGNDTLTGGAGNDSLTGGAGADTFVFNASFGNDIITDFTATAVAGHDVLDFAASIFGTGAAGFAAFSAAAVQQGAAVRVTVDASNSIILNNVTKANLVAADFTTH